MHTFSVSHSATASATEAAIAPAITRDHPVAFDAASGSPHLFELSSVAFFGRSLAEYAQFFALDFDASPKSERSGSADALSSEDVMCTDVSDSRSSKRHSSFRYVSDRSSRDDLGSSSRYVLKRETKILDVAAGPSAFTAQANRLGLRATAVDPLYGCSPDALATHVQLDYARTFGQMRAKPGNFRFKSFASINDAERDRRAAAQTFLADYEAGFLDNRYVGGALPNLPFEHASFDVVLCAHLLFIYERLFDYDFHLAACRELVRVSRDEVRIHPVCGPDGKPYRHLAQLCAELAADGIASEVVQVDYEFFNGSDTTLILKRT